ncbi:MAG: hypothetical protein CL946_04365 [Ectothiorhodospiraceae bacterium]|nr:hypothetical protein [Ectothiorhodospiraceae bacterium]
MVTALFVCTLTASLDAQDAEVVAMVTAVNGSGTVEANGTTEALEIGRELPSGAKIILDGGNASIVFMDGQLFELAAGDRLELGADLSASTITGGGGTRGVADGETVAVADGDVARANNDKWQSQMASIYGVRGDASVAAVSPRLTVANQTPTFFWFDGDSVAAGRSKTYTLLVRDPSGKTVVSQELTGTVYELNKQDMMLSSYAFDRSPGTVYTWGVYAKGTEPAESESLPASFVFVDTEGQERAREKEVKLQNLVETGSMDETSYHTLMSLYYADERERLFSDAIPHLYTLLDNPSGKKFAATQLAQILNRFGNEVSTAAAYFARKARYGM